MPRVLSAILFSPRGGSALVARTLARRLPDAGWDVRLLAGSRDDLDDDGDARRFYAGLDLRVVDFGAALREPDPMRPRDEHVAPMHPSYEDRPAAPDRVFASLDDLAYEAQVRAWGRALREAGAARADVLHLHHLTPINEAASRVSPAVPVVGQLHGTELLMLERIGAGPPAGWRFAGRWAGRLRGWAQRCSRLAVAPGSADRAASLLGVDRGRCVEIANGVDVERFRAVEVDRAEHWRRHLVERPRGWRPGEGPGSVSYRREELEPLIGGTVLVYVGRYTEVKRLDVLIRAFAAAQERTRSPAALVLVGGHPGEWEGEHPYEAVRSTGARNVFLAGWHEQERLPAFLSAADVLVHPSGREQFGLVMVEGMACGLPVIAAASSGARGIVEDGRTGWLVEPGDSEALAAAIVEAVDDPAERRRRGARARRTAVERYSDRRTAADLAAALELARGGDPGRQAVIDS
jgi:glycosyltransferase involved in cell wall biosynthesis